MDNIRPLSGYRAYDPSVPEFLHELPIPFRNEVLKNVEKTEGISQSHIEKIDDNNFKVASFEIPDLFYLVNFNKPSCSCYYFQSTNIVCKHFCLVFKWFPKNGWETLDIQYRESPFFNLDQVYSKLNYSTPPRNDSLDVSKQNKSMKKSIASRFRGVTKELNDLSYVMDDPEQLVEVLGQIEAVKDSVHKKLGTDSGLIIDHESKSHGKKRTHSPSKISNTQFSESDNKISDNIVTIPKHKKRKRNTGRHGIKKEMEDTLVKPKFVPWEYNLSNLHKCPICDVEVGMTNIKCHLKDVHGLGQCPHCDIVFSLAHIKEHLEICPKK